MLRRSFAVLALSGLAVAGVPLLAQPALAISAPVDFSAGKLPTWQTNGVVSATASAQGLVFVGGTFTRIRPPGENDTTTDGSGNTVPNPDDLNRAGFAVLDAGSGNPTSCALDLGGSSATLRSMDVSPNGATLYVGGYFTSIGGAARTNLAAVDIASCTVTPWAPAANSYVKAIKATATTVYVGGGFSTVDGISHLRAAAVDTSGTLLPGFNASFDGTPQGGLTPDVNALNLKSDGSVLVVGGNFDTADGADSHALGVVDATTGALVKAFPGFLGSYVSAVNRGSAVKTIAVDSSGFYVGAEGSGKFIFDGRVAVNWGAYDERWRDGCLGATQALLIYDNLLYIGSHAHDCSNMRQYGDGQRRHFLAETTGSSSPDDHAKPVLQGWTPDTNDGIGEGIGPRTLTIGTSGGVDYLWSGGEFTTVNGLPQQGLTRFGHSTTVGPTVVPVLTATSYRSGQVTLAARATTDNDDDTLTYRFYRDGGSSPAYTTTQSSLPWNRPQVTWSDTQTAGTTHTYGVTASDGTATSSSATATVTVTGASSPYATRIDADGPLFHLRYDEASGLFLSDSSSNGNNLRLNATPNITYQGTGAIAGDPSKAMTFGGTATDYAVTEKRFDAPPTSSLETWFKTTSGAGGKLIGFTDSQTLPSQDYNSANAEHHVPDKLLYLNNAGQLYYGTEAPPSSNGTESAKTTINSPAAYADGTWHYAVATEDSSGMSLYVDGARVARNTVTTQGGGNGFWRVGGDAINGWPSGPASGYLAGTLDETAVYPRALSATEVSEHYALGGGAFQNGPTDFYGKTVYDDAPLLQWRLNEASGSVANDSTGTGRRGSYQGGVTYAQPSAVAGTSGTAARSVTLNGTTGLIYATVSSASLPSFTTEAWVKTTSTTGGQIAGFGSAATGDSATQDRKTWFRADGRISFGVRQGSAYNVITSATAYNDGAFHHVVSTKSATSMALWVDGVQVASAAVTANQSYTGYWRFGEDAMTGWPGAATTKYLAGSFDELAVYNGVLPDNRIRAHYSGGVPGLDPDQAPPTAPSAVTVGLSGADVSLSWRAALDNRGVTGYEIHRSTTSGFTPSAADLIATVTGTSYLDLGVVQGTFYYRVVALDAAGNATSSSQVSVIASDVTPPTTPTGVTATGGSSTAALAWTAATDNVGVVSYQVYRSATSGTAPSAATLVGTTTDPSFTDTSPANGTWYYVVTAQDGAGNVSAASAEVSAVIADVTAPSAPTTLTGTSGYSAALSWDAATDDTAVTGYQLHRSSTPGFSPSSATLVKTVTTTTTSDTPGLGTWYYRVLARDAAGNLSGSSPEASVNVATSSTQTPTADTYANQGAPSTNYGTSGSLVSNGTGGSSAGISYLRFVLPTVPTGSSITSAALRIHTSTRAKCGCDASSLASHQISFASDSWDEATLTWNLKPALTGGVLGTLVSPSTEDATFDTQLAPSALQAAAGTQVTLAMQGTSNDNLWFISSNSTTVANRPQLLLTLSPTGFDPQAPTQPVSLATTRTAGTLHLTWKASTDPLGSPTYNVYRSATAGTAPSAATLVGTSATSAYDDNPGLGTWYYRVIAVDGTRSSPASAELSAVVPDYTPPSAPTGIVLTSNGPAVSLSWADSTDNVGVQSYEVHRSSTSGFTPSAATLVTTETGTSATDTVAAGTSYYLIVAKDAVGNSGTSAEQPLVVTDSTPPTAVTGLTATQSGQPVALTWSGATDAFGVTYHVYRATTSGVAPSGSTDIGTTTATSFTDPTPPTGPAYYQVVALDPSGNAGPTSNEATLTVADATPPATVSDLTGTRPNNALVLTWSAVADNTGVAAYAVYRATAPGVTATAGNLVATTTTPGFTDAAAPGTFYYAVAAKDGAGNTAHLSNEVAVTVDDKSPPTIPSGLAASASSTSVSLSWTGSSDDVAVQNYEIHRATTDAFTTSSSTLLATTSGPVTSYVDHPGGGIWYYRVIAVDTSGNTSVSPSNTATATLTDSTPPTSPTNLAASQTAAPVILTWTAATDDYGVVAYDVYRSSSSGSTGTLVGSSGTATYSDNAPLGTAYYSVVARDAAGNQSAPSAQLGYTVLDKTPPTQPVVTATVTGTTVALSWPASTDNAVVASYEVHRSASSSFTPSATTLVNSTTGTTYTDSPGAGTWYYRVIAIDGSSNRSTPSDPVTAPGVGAGAQTVVTLAPTADTFANQGAPSTNNGTSASLLSRGSPGGISYLRFVIPAAPAGTTLTAAALKLKTTTDSTAGSVDTHVIGTASDSWTESALTWNNRPALTGVTLGTLSGATATSTAYTVTLDPSQVAPLVGTQTTWSISDSGSDSLYVWSKDFGTAAARPSLVLTYVAASDSQPPTAPASLGAQVSGPTVSLSWTPSSDNTGVTGYEVFRSATSGFTASAANRIATPSSLGTTDTPGTGTWYYLVDAKDAAGNVSPVSNQVAAVVSPDTTAPSSPGTPTTTVAGASVTVTWSASTDDFAVTGNDVHRSSTSGFTPSTTTLVTSTAGTSVTDAPGAGTWYYRVIAKDAAGNTSAPSGQGSATVAVSGPPTVTTLTPLADTFVNSGAPSTNYGTNASLLSRGSPGGISYLRFVLPAAPAGKTLTGAVLRIHTTTDSTAGSGDSHTVQVADDSWVETTTTWSTRTPVAGPVLGSITGPTAVNTSYDTALSVSALSALLGTQQSVGVTDTGTDSLYFWSSNFGTAASRPQLILTFS